MHYQFFRRYPRRISEVLGSKIAAGKPQYLHNTVGRACWDVDVPKIDIVTTEDVALPVEQQEAMIKSVWDDTWSVKYIASSHSPFLSRIDEFVGILEDLI